MLSFPQHSTPPFKLSSVSSVPVSAVWMLVDWATDLQTLTVTYYPVSLTFIEKSMYSLRPIITYDFAFNKKIASLLIKKGLIKT